MELKMRTKFSQDTWKRKKSSQTVRCQGNFLDESCQEMSRTNSMKHMYCFQCFLRNCVQIVWCSAQPPSIPWQVIWTKNRSRALNLTSDHKIFLMGFSFNTNHRVWGLDTEIWNAYVALPITVGAKQLVRQLHSMAICISDELGSLYYWVYHGLPHH